VGEFAHHNGERLVRGCLGDAGWAEKAY
jgi:hypothetical protein